MKKQNKRLFWFDSETSGVDPSFGHQMLSVAIQVENHQGKILDTLDIKIKLKPQSKVDEGALLVNHIDPYSDEFNDGALSYKEAFNEIKNFITLNYCHDEVNIAIAYKAQFDVDFLEKMFSEENCVFKNNFDKIICPYPLAKKLTKSNIIKTDLKFNGDKTSYRSCKLEDVANALDTKEIDIVSHTALGDVKMMRKTIKKVWSIAYGQDILDNQDLNRFSDLQIYPERKVK